MRIKLCQNDSKPIMLNPSPVTPCALAGLRRGAMRGTQANELRPGIPRRGPELLREL
jgi:hypothetical protein